MKIDYREVDSPYIRALIQGSPFATHERIDDLIQLRRYMVASPASFEATLHYTSLQSRYPSEFEDLQRELGPSRLRPQPGPVRKNAQRDKGPREPAKFHCWLAAGGMP